MKKNSNAHFLLHVFGQILKFLPPISKKLNLLR